MPLDELGVDTNLLVGPVRRGELTSSSTRSITLCRWRVPMFSTHPLESIEPKHEFRIAL
jgi:hypothetical protein